MINTILSIYRHEIEISNLTLQQESGHLSMRTHKVLYDTDNISHHEFQIMNRDTLRILQRPDQAQGGKNI